MRLADFIDTNLSPILEEWDRFAVTLLPAAGFMDATALRDHAEQMLKAIATDLRTAQTAEQQLAKSKGLNARALIETAAEGHGTLRASSGFTIRQLVSEYRALRASVLSLYAAAHPPAKETLEDIGRFNEALDQAVAESVDFYATEVERWRNIFLGVLGHDLRGPLDAILMTSQLLPRQLHDPQVSETLARLTRSGQRMRELLDDLLDYNRTSQEHGIPVRREMCSLKAVCQAEVDQCRAAYSSHTLRFVPEVEAKGMWDPSRIKQALGNLIGNAAQHGTSDGSVVVRLTGNESTARISVANSGPAIPSAMLEAIFEPYRRGRHDEHAPRRNLGLGLFIVKEIARAHGGRVDVKSDGGTTVFTMTLPIAAS